MKKRSFTLLMSALTISATLIGTSPVAAKTDTEQKKPLIKKKQLQKMLIQKTQIIKKQMHPRVIH